MNRLFSAVREEMGSSSTSFDPWLTVVTLNEAIEPTLAGVLNLPSRFRFIH